MEIRDFLKHIPWLEPWPSVRGGEEATELVRACAALPAPEPTTDLNDVIAASKAFPVPFPIDTVRLEKLKQRCPVKRLVENIESTYPVMHERVLWLIANFLIYKRKYGSSIEKKLYQDMTVAGFIDRLMLKRAATFMKAQDQYKLLSGKTGKDGWEEVGTEDEKPPLLLKDCLSYDEMKISALVYVSGHTECINDGRRKNVGVVDTDDVEPNAVIIGIVGPRFKRPNRMECEDILATAEQNVETNGYGTGEGGEAGRKAYRQLWDDFYQIPSVTFTDLTKQVKLTGGAKAWLSRWVGVKGAGFDNTAYYRRLALTADVTLLEADERARVKRTTAFLNVIGAGLGIWKHSPHQLEVFVVSFLERITSLLDAGRLSNVSDVNFAYIQPKNKQVLDLFKPNKGSEGEDIKSMFIKNDAHPRGGIHVHLWSREPSTKLCAEHSGKLLVLTYAWDSNALPGNEFWMGKLSTSGDSAAACATQISELHTAHINTLVRANRTKIAAERLVNIQDYCTEA